MGGFFNCPLNPIVDEKGGILRPRQCVIDAIERLQWELDLHDIRRIKNPTTRSFTWSQSEPLILSRLDYWFVSNSSSHNESEVDIIPSIKRLDKHDIHATANAKANVSMPRLPSLNECVGSSNEDNCCQSQGNSLKRCFKRYFQV